MNFPIINKQILAPNIKRLDVEAPGIARRVKPGQFVMVTLDERSEKIPLSVVEANIQRGTIALIIQEVGPSTIRLGALQIKDEIASILGPLGLPATIEKVGVVVCIASGIGATRILPICRAFKQKKNKVVGIMGAKTKKELVLEAQVRLSCHKIFITTDDGSYVRRGSETDLLKEFLDGEKVDLVYAAGSLDMMRGVCHLTRDKGIRTLVNLSPVMVDGLGLCGSCRVKVAGEQVLACVDGPEFDGHRVDFDDLGIRINAFKDIEQCLSRPFLPFPKRNEPKILTRFLKGILKK